MAAEPPIELPIFPLGLVALPGEGVPLHIFEERYKQMIAHCLRHAPGERGRCFVILWLDEKRLRSVGCACEVEDVLERAEDGRINILARGRDPVHLVERLDTLEFPAGLVTLLPDEGEVDLAATTEARELYRELVVEATDRELEYDELEELSAYAMAATVEFPPAEKQQLLELRSEAARMRLLADMLREAMRRLRLADIAEVRARSNGHLWYGWGG